MSCPPEIANILLNLITLGILRLRAHPHDPNRCVIEADHIHNLPALIGNYSRSSLLYYWDVERPSFIKQINQIPEAGSMAFEAFWDELRVHAESREVANIH
jgi:hypothetical protein